MNKIQEFLNKNKHSDENDELVIFFTFASLLWVFTAAFKVIDKGWWIALFAVVYFGIGTLIYIYIRRRIAAKQNKQPPLSVKIICISILILNWFLLTYVYIMGILNSTGSLLITTVFNLFIIIFCVETWVCKSKKIEKHSYK